MKPNNIPDGFPYSGETCFLPGSDNLKDYLHGGFLNTQTDLIVSSILKRFISKYGIPVCGRNRATFVSKFVVFKIPLNHDGVINNQTEANFRSNVTAKSKMMAIEGISCLVQEKVSPIVYDYNQTELTEWSHLIECGQIGSNRRQQMKAFDYAETDLTKLTNIIS